MTAPLNVIDVLIGTVDPHYVDIGSCFSWAQAEAIYAALLAGGLIQPTPTPADGRVLEAVATWEDVVSTQAGGPAFAAASTSLAYAARDRKQMLSGPGLRAVPE